MAPFPVTPVANLPSVGFTITQGVNSVMVYIIDAYRPIAGEAIVAMISFKGMVLILPTDKMQIFRLINSFF